MQKSFILLSIIGIALVSSAPSTLQTNTTIQVLRDTQPCNNGYYFTGQSCMPCLLSIQIANSNICTCSVANTCTALSCAAGFQASSDNTQCLVVAPTPLGCLTYGTGTDAVVCYTCSTGYSLVGGVCIPSQNCAVFSATTAACTTCNDTFYYAFNTLTVNVAYTLSSAYFNQFGAQCAPCMANCKQCTSGTSCNTCQMGFYYNFYVNSQNGNNACSSCATACATCTDSPVLACLTCFPGYFQNPTTKVCATCTIQGCTSCASATTCGVCYSGAGTVSSDGLTCTAPPAPIICGTGCLTCSSASVCTSCNSLYALINSVCYACGTGCNSCGQLGTTTTTTCKTCFDTYSMVKASDQTVANNCLACSTSNNQWLRCSGVAELNPKAPLMPTECQDNNFLYLNGTNTSCIAYSTPNTCLTIQNQNANDCLLCLPGMTKMIGTGCQSCPLACNACAAVNGAVQCTTCATGFYISSDKLSCSPCTAGCTACSDANTCTACASGFYQNGKLCTVCSTSNCASCPNNVCATCYSASFFFSTSTATSIIAGCYACPAGCATCGTTGQNCLTCQPGFLLSNNGCVSLAQANCQKNDIVLGCTICNYGFYLSNKQCYECVNPYSANVCRASPAASSNTGPNAGGSGTAAGTGSGPTANTTNSSATNAQYLSAAAIISSMIMILQ